MKRSYECFIHVCIFLFYSLTPTHVAMKSHSNGDNHLPLQYTDYVRYVEPCFRGTLVQADLDNREVSRLSASFKLRSPKPARSNNAAHSLKGTHPAAQTTFHPNPMQGTPNFS